MAEGLDIRTNVVVHAVRSSSDGVEIDTDGQTFSARAVVVAVPVGVLQALGSLTGETLGPPPSRHDNPRLGRHPFGRGAYAGPEPLPHGLFVRWMSKSFGQAWSPGPSMNPQPLGGMPA
ncbi:FAD-dependent oxidoreductase [Specibacter sp. AOP5-B1-6]|uniref:FAD-dependent oxidoreductase n=1 Tax=Specibacter sp. AOP5-B1-6 TaxID=3457653 RepID=UPI00402B8999